LSQSDENSSSTTDAERIQAALAGLPLGPLRYYASLASTNSQAAEWAAAGAPHLALVVADEQTGGRGRAGRRWYTPPGAALAFSLVLRPETAPDPQRLIARLTALGALAVSDALIAGCHLAVEIKWPNDVLVHRCKLCGVLAEATWQGDQLREIILGIGVNVGPESVPPKQELLFPATCVEHETGSRVDRWQLLRRILICLLDRLENLDSEAFFQDWQARLAFRSEWVQLTGASATLEGRLAGLGSDGALQLALPSGEIISVYTGDLRLRPR
jgi:BirA family biotin operon repressor/biotin-[acetyl-CoA-carboxylase] ligase